MHLMDVTEKMKVIKCSKNRKLVTHDQINLRLIMKSSFKNVLLVAKEHYYRILHSDTDIYIYI